MDDIIIIRILGIQIIHIQDGSYSLSHLLIPRGWCYIKNIKEECWNLRKLFQKYIFQIYLGKYV